VNLSWGLPLLLAMQTRSAGVSPRPVAWAAQSPRPAACLSAPGLWEVSRQASLGRRCRELARAQALLLRAPDKARERAEALLQYAPDFAEARVLRGRASLRVGDAKAALADLTPLLADDAAAVADPATLLDAGRAALLQHDVTTAERFYRALGSRAALLPDRSQQVVAYVEIAGTLLVTEQARADDVQAFLREARRRSAGSGFSGLCAALTAVTWLTQGREAEAQAALGEVSDVDALVRLEARRDVQLPDGLFHALLGVVLEHAQPELSLKHYQALAEGPLAKNAVGKLAARGRARPVAKPGPTRAER
jgi:tetratricopeptide (TPR) repeat protein